jgi:anti-sigma factor RsiW
MNDKNFDSSANSDRLESFECRDVTARLGDLVDNDLPDLEKKAVEAHLDRCPECASFFASYRHVVQSAAELREPEEPLAVDVQNRLRKALNMRLGIDLPYIA